MTSHTVHVFWVKNDADLISAWETALGTVGTVVDVDATSSGDEDEDELGA
ncbi:hypothetical protein [Klebsiella pneumoniae]|nr:hypothetical protein [Klebsiella pneumoniae]MCL0234425.1 hypothetical protein [Klebsiella pneumoniae]